MDVLNSKLNFQISIDLMSNSEGETDHYTG